MTALGTMPYWGDIAVCARAGLFLDILQLAPPDPGGETTLDQLRHQIAKKISRLEARHPGNQALLESLVPMRAWLQGRLSDYHEWVLPCLDYLYLSLAARHGPSVLEPVMSVGFFDFSTFQKHFAEGESSDSDEQSPEALDRLLRLLREMTPVGPEAARELDLIDFLLNAGTPDQDYVYVDGQGFCETPRQKQARERALHLVDHCPDVAEYHRRLGFSLLILGEFANAIVCFQRQQRHTPDAGVIDDNIAWCQMKLGWLDDALANGKRALARAPEKSDVHHDYAGILFVRRQLEEALDVTRGALAFPEPVIQLYYLHALLVDSAGRTDEAVGPWLDYLKRARGQPGHQKAVARALVSLKTLGHSYSVTSYPIRTIAEQTIQAVSDRVEEVRGILKQHEVPFERLEELELELVNSGWNSMDALETRCRELFDESEKCLNSAPLFVMGKKQIPAIFEEWRQAAKERGVPYYVLLRDGVKPLLQQVGTVLKT
jgi:tetratricopeptide (TPR) repeat protein